MNEDLSPELDHSNNPQSKAPSNAAGLNAAGANLASASDALNTLRTGTSAHPAQRANRIFPWVTGTAIFIGLGLLATLIIQITVEGFPRFNLNLIRWMPSSLAEEAGIQSALFGTIWVVGITALLCIPIGVATAVYLEEFANRERWYTRLIELNIQNLAAVPSIVYGILGLAFLVRGLSLGPTILAAALTLTLVVLPTVIIASREAIRAVPSSLRHASLGLGATELQTIRKVVLPAAVPGIATGAILALSRAIGEAAPLLIVGGVTFISFNPHEGGVLKTFGSEFAVMPLQIFNWIGRPQEEFRTLAAAAIMLLLIVLLAMNSVALFVRNRHQRNS
jgi:phosphate transport system permease protein